MYHGRVQEKCVTCNLFIWRKWGHCVSWLCGGKVGYFVVCSYGGKRGYYVNCMWGEVGLLLIMHHGHVAKVGPLFIMIVWRKLGHYVSWSCAECVVHYVSWLCGESWYIMYHGRVEGKWAARNGDMSHIFNLNSLCCLIFCSNKYILNI